MNAVVDGHNHLMIEVAKRRQQGIKGSLVNEFLPRIQAGGVRLIMMIVGGDNTSLTAGSDNMLWGTISVMDALFQEIEESGGIFALCRTGTDIDAALAAGQVALLMGLEGVHPLEGSPISDSLATLRVFHRLGLRSVQLVDNRRNRAADGAAEARTRGGLSRFGVELVRECNRLGILIDVAHLTDAGCYDVLEIAEAPILDTHSNARALCDHARNLTDERIRAMAANGGVIGVSAGAALVSSDATRPATLDDLLRHIDHLVEVAGVDHVGLGPDHAEDMGWSPAPGWIGGVYYGMREGGFFVQGFENITGFPRVADALLQHGYSHPDVEKIMGGNFLRVYRQVLR